MLINAGFDLVCSSKKNLETYIKMAEAAIIGATASSYEGNAGLGGGSFGVGKIDTTPLEDLAKYTMLYNRAEYEQKQKDAEAAAKEIADATSYDLTTSIPKDAKLLQEKYDKLQSFMRENPDAINYRNKELWTQYKTMRNDLENDLRGAKVRDLMNKVRQKEVADQTTPELKSYLQTKLDEEIDKTDIRTPIKWSSQFDIAPVAITAAPIKKVQTTEIGKNIIGQESWELPDMDALNNRAITTATGLDNLTNFESQEWFKALTPQEQAQVREQNKAQQASGKLEPVESATYFNQALKSLDQSYYITDAAGNKTLDINKIKQSNNSILSGVTEQVDIYNRKMDEMVNAISKGYFKDQFGNQLHFGNDASGLKESSYKKINLNDGLQPEELIKMRMLGITPPPERTIKITQTDQQLDQAKLAETIRHNKASEGIDWGQLKLAKDKWQQSMTGGETVKNGAMERAKRIYEDLRKIADKNGTISPDKIRLLNVEQLKYLGIEQVDQSTTGVAKSIFTPLTFTPDNEYAIQLDNGQVNVMKPKDGKRLGKTSTGGFSGDWDNTKSTNIFNIATNILNEELTKAGTKELNSYMPIDLSTGGVSVNTTGATTNVSGSTTTETKTFKLPKGKPETVKQNGYTYKWNYSTGKYE